MSNVNVIGQNQIVSIDVEDSRRLIRGFNALYYGLECQTWLATQWMGVNVFKTPTDLWIYQELIYAIKPDLIIETGTCMGGSALFMRHVLSLVNPSGKVITIDITQQNLRTAAKVPGIEFICGSSTDKDVVQLVKAFVYAHPHQRVMVVLDSDHEEHHVLRELELYAPLVSKGSILIVEDTNNHLGPKAAVEQWYPQHMNEFEKNVNCEKFMLTFNRDGYYERIA